MLMPEVKVLSSTNYPSYLQVFFCKYNDPIYVKMEKLEIMIKLASDRNIDQVLQYFCLIMNLFSQISLHHQKCIKDS